MTPSSTESRRSSIVTARWVGALFLAGIVFQRFAVPGLPIALLLPVVILWAAFAMRHRVVELDSMRLLLWCTAFGVTGIVILLQPALVPAPLISLQSWALVFATSLPFVVRLVERSTETFLTALRYVVNIGGVLAGACLVMTLSQFAGVPYRDVLGDLFPRSLLLQGFAISYPYSYGSPLYRANAWIGLEPSFVSFQLGIALLAALLLRRSVLTVVLLLAGIVTTASGSGILIVVVGLFALLAWPQRRLIWRYLAPLAAVIGIILTTTYGQALLSRSDEFANPHSSTSLRSVQPYLELWPRWAADIGTTVFGGGPGSSQDHVSGTAVGGLLVPTPAKIFFDYGLLGGSVLALFLLFCYFRAPSPTLATTLFVSLWTIQPGLTSTVLVINVVVLVSLWSPRIGSRIEDGRRAASRAAVGPGAARRPTGRVAVPRRQ